MTSNPWNGDVSGTFNACVYPPERVDPFVDADATSSLLKICLIIRKMGEGSWNLDTPP